MQRRLNVVITTVAKKERLRSKLIIIISRLRDERASPINYIRNEHIFCALEDKYYHKIQFNW